jgi:hypothetical protein
MESAVFSDDLLIAATATVQCTLEVYCLYRTKIMHPRRLSTARELGHLAASADAHPALASDHGPLELSALAVYPRREFPLSDMGFLAVSKRTSFELLFTNIADLQPFPLQEQKFSGERNMNHFV